MKNRIRFVAIAFCAIIASETTAFAQRRPAPPPSRYSYTIEIDKSSLPKGVTARTVSDKLGTRHFISNSSDIPLIINERFHVGRLATGTKLVSGKVYQYFPSGVPMQGKRHLKGWQAPFGEIKETILRLPKEPAKIYEGRTAGLSEKLPPDEQATIAANYDGKPIQIKIVIKYHLNPKYDTHHANR